MKSYIVAALIIILAVVVFSTGFFINKERAFDENLQLKQENENLKAEIQKSRQVLGASYQPSASDYLTGKVFSTYPFNIKNQLTINIGEEQGVKKMAPATFGENILLGQVIGISENYSVVRTIFDSNWQLPVRIGDKEINGLLQGGNEPKITFIEKDKPVNVGDVVYSAKQGFPYAVKIGEIAELKESAPGVFKEALLKIPFSVSDLREIKILTAENQE